MNPSAILTITASAMDWVLANFPAIGILVFIAWCIWKYISWLDTKFSSIDTKFLELRSDVTLDFVKVRAEMSSGFAKVDTELKIINHCLNEHDKRISGLETKLDSLATFVYTNVTPAMHPKPTAS